MVSLLRFRGGFISEYIEPAASPAAAPPPFFYSSPSFNEALRASRFVKGFGITALIYSIVSMSGLNLLGGGIGGGIGLFIFRYDDARYYRVLGTILMIFAFVGFLFIPFLGFGIGSGVLSGAVLAKGIKALNVLSKEGRHSKQWPASWRQALIGTVAAGIGLVISIGLLILAGLSILFNGSVTRT